MELPIWNAQVPPPCLCSEALLETLGLLGPQFDAALKCTDALKLVIYILKLTFKCPVLCKG